MSHISPKAVERLCRSASVHHQGSSSGGDDEHPFVKRYISGELPSKVRELFDGSHYEQASMHAFAYLDKRIQALSGLEHEIGTSLMMKAFQFTKKDGVATSVPMIKIGDLSTLTGQNEQDGMKFLAAGSVQLIRNPRGHELTMGDSPDRCLEFLSVCSLVLRILKERTS